MNIPDSTTWLASQNRGRLVIGIRGDQPGISYVDNSGELAGFDVDIARWMAAELGFDASSIEFKEIATSNREDALGSGEVDLMLLG